MGSSWYGCFDMDTPDAPPSAVHELHAPNARSRGCMRWSKRGWGMGLQHYIMKYRKQRLTGGEFEEIELDWKFSPKFCDACQPLSKRSQVQRHTEGGVLPLDSAAWCLTASRSWTNCELAGPCAPEEAKRARMMGCRIGAAASILTRARDLIWSMVKLELNFSDGQFFAWWGYLLLLLLLMKRSDVKWCLAWSELKSHDLGFLADGFLPRLFPPSIALELGHYDCQIRMVMIYQDWRLQVNEPGFYTCLRIFNSISHILVHHEIFAIT